MRSRSDGIDKLIKQLESCCREFRHFDCNDWPHLVNNEDYSRVFSLPQSQMEPLDQLYKTGRNAARFFGSLSKEFDNIRRFPTYRSFVLFLEQQIPLAIAENREVVEVARTVHLELEEPPWAVGKMIEVANTQIAIMKSLRPWVRQAKTVRAFDSEAVGFRARTVSLARRVFRSLGPNIVKILVGVTIAVLTAALVALLIG